MFTVSYFFVRSYVSIVEFDRSPSSSLDASKLGRVQIPVGRDGGVNSMGVKMAGKITISRTPCPPPILPMGI